MDTLAALDLGAGKFACLAATSVGTGEESELAVRGVGRCAARRGPAGMHFDHESAVRAVGLVLDQALRMAGAAETPMVGLAFSGPDIASDLAEGVVRLAKTRPVDARDAAAALAAAEASAPPPGRRTLYAAPLGYRLDDGDRVLDPRGLVGARLFVDVVVVHAPEEAVRAAEATCAAARAAPVCLAPSPLVAGLAALTEAERNDGVALLDIGDCRTGLALFRHGALQHAETIGEGGSAVTRALAELLPTSFQAAERLKLNHGGLALTGREEAVEAPVLGLDGRLEPGVVLRGAVSDVAGNALGRIFEIAARRLDAIGAAGAPVALAGGVSLTPGIAPFAARILRRPVRSAMPLNVSGLQTALDGAAFAASAGLLRFMLDEAAQRPHLPVRALAAAGPLLKRGLGEAVSWLKENF